MATDADIYAFEQEFDEMDEWEAMHANEMEAAEEAMLAMETEERGAASSSSASKAASGPPNQQISKVATAEQPATTSGMSDAQDSLYRAQSRLESVLARTSALLGEDPEEADPAADVSMEDAERMGACVARGRKATAEVDTTTAPFLFSRPPIDVDSQPVVLRDGKRMFLRKKTASQSFQEASACRNAAAGAASLIPIKDMMASIERSEIEAAMAKDAQPPSPPGSPADATVTAADATSNATLWLDKYRPQQFTDLLSDERTNREVLSWIKKWDAFVFPKKKRPQGSALPISPAKARGLGGMNSKAAWHPLMPKPSGAGHGGASDEPEDKRPFEKLILICGPPGAGKTTLANIVARHAGYNPIEVNASDDRTAAVLKNKLVSAMEMQSIFGERKPNCLILDEIDGALNGSDGKSAIAALQEIVAAPLAAKKKPGAKTPARNRHPLTRPLICICNDQYASVLRPLRQMAKIFVLDTPQPQRLITRLKFICRREGVKGSTGALAALCSSGDNDIRYCVNTLQFQSTQSRAAAAAAAVGEAKPGLATLNTKVVGQKDHTHGVFDAMDLVFYEPRSKAAKGTQPVAQRIQEAAVSLGNFPLLINGLDENVPKMIFNDPTMNKMCDVFEWLGLADTWETRARADQQFVFTNYIPFAAVAVHAACCTGSRRRIEYPRAHYESLKRSERSQNILRSLTEGAQLQPTLRMSASVLVVDVVPWLLATLSPHIRRINPSLQSKDEKAMIQRLIQLMASLGLSFRPKYLPDGSEDYALEPALHELVMFRGGEGNATAQSMLPANVRKMITREVELEQMRRSESAAATPKASKSKSTLQSGETDKSKVKDKADASKKPTFVLPELNENDLAKKEEAQRKRNPFAFAHREAKRKRDELLSAQIREDHRDGDGGNARPTVRYKFNEGYTCGIKTAVYVRDLL